MFSKFIDRFRKTDDDEVRAFQKKVLSIVQKLYVDREFAASVDPAVLMSGETQLGLTNLYAVYLANGPGYDLKQIVKEHFDRVLSPDARHDQDLDWLSAKTMLMPQLMPADFVSRMPLVHKPFVADVLIGYVLDLPESYAYINEKQFDAWNISLDELHSNAVANLEQRSRGIEINVTEGVNAMLFVGVGDGFDAVRITLLHIQEIAVENVGKHFFFGIPNRDFLVCWSASGEAEFLSQMREKVMSDSQTMPYPLCGEVLSFDSDGRAVIVEAALEPRAIHAINN